MLRLVSEKSDDLRAACARRGVVRLELFGSGAGDPFDPATSDLDFLVDFRPMEPIQHADSFFGLQEDLERMFGVPVDLVEPKTIKNPFFRESIQSTRTPL